MKNVVFWDIETQVLPHITPPLQSPAGQCYVGFEVFTAVTEECRLPRCYAVRLLEEPTFRRNFSSYTSRTA
jgi:hypothetical protein